MQNRARAYRIGSHFYDSHRIQDTLLAEIDRLQHQLEKVQTSSSEARRAMADTYEDMIQRRRQLLQLIRNKAYEMRTAEASPRTGTFN